jgi:hypothetical protein
MHYLLSYELVEDYLQRRELFRAEHLALAWQCVERGELPQAGAEEARVALNAAARKEPMTERTPRVDFHEETARSQVWALHGNLMPVEKALFEGV